MGCSLLGVGGVYYRAGSRPSATRSPARELQHGHEQVLPELPHELLHVLAAVHGPAQVDQNADVECDQGVHDQDLPPARENAAGDLGGVLLGLAGLGVHPEGVDYRQDGLFLQLYVYTHIVRILLNTEYIQYICVGSKNYTNHFEV